MAASTDRRPPAAPAPHSLAGLPREASRFLSRPGGRLHFIDSGQGDPVVMLHGNPTWHYYFRRLITALTPHYRCIAPDHLGCGLSDKPTLEQYDFSLRSRIDDLDALLDHLGLTGNITLVLHDWGGMIGLGWAVRQPERIRRIVAMNTACTGLPPGKRMPASLRLGRNTRLGAWLILRHNLFCRLAARWCVSRRPLTPEVRAMYLQPYDTPAHRLAVLKFVQTIPLTAADAGWATLQQVEAALPSFAHVPTLLLWGLRDFVFDRHFLAAWQQHFPQADTHIWPDCGHYLLEDAAEEVIPRIQHWLQRN